MSFIPIPETEELLPQPLPGKVEQMITPTRPGRVRFQATFWTAEFYYSDCQVAVLPGMSVNVVGRRGITLLVIPIGYVSHSQFAEQEQSNRDLKRSSLFRWLQAMSLIFA